MTVASFFKLYGVALITFFAMDLLWLGVVARGFYQTHMPAVDRQSFAHAVLLGALFGLVTYAAYDLTNLATLDGFPVKVALVDLVWGAVLCATVSATTYLASTRLI
jgi:uncharacterized membrane protein